ncbi:sensor histidine kinase [Wenyingzhuangia aestuarii]|uniref:sensor histidine kinase n=1 Tax=Wenyingzhuangia aestuarii TaxID=1647582 RepID=UPI00143C5087|nr:sensor histidine kinase [Wenyingzhuangia aestuarii]NJB81534.1 signal transduction histidine kinase [Wenyingzhuangia aestuarii]
MNLVELLSHPNENGILEFVLGVLFILSIYHLFLFFQNKDKAYLYYSLYTFLTIFGYICLAKNNITSQIIAPIQSSLEKFDVYSKFLYNAMYFVFAFEFVGISSKSKKWTQYIFYPLIFIVFVGTVAQVISLITQNNSYIFNTFHLFFIPAIFVPTIIGYIALFKFSFIGKSYIIWGSFILFISSMTGVLLHHVLGSDETNEIRFTVFYIGLILENICFSLAIGYKHKLVLEQNQKREQLYLQKMLNSQEEERIRIAKELHDGIVQKIGTVILCMRNNVKNLSEEKRTTIVSELSYINQDLRNVSHRMMPKALTDLGLKFALMDLLESSFQYTDIGFEFNDFNVDHRFDSKIEHNLYRISQELIQNIIKHSKAKRVSFLLLKNKTNVLLKVEDDGVGFPVLELKKGVGLDNIQTRATLLQGKVSIESNLEKGTIITVKIPWK